MTRSIPLILLFFSLNAACSQDFFQACIDQAITHKRNKKFAHAEASFKKAIETDRSRFEGHWGLAIVYHLQNKLKDAAQKYEEALRIQPGHHDAMMRLAKVRKDQSRFIESMELYKKMMKNNPDDNLAQAGFTQAQLQYETERFSQYVQNDGSIQNKTIMVRYEWNLGDSMQFIRYIQTLKKYGATIILFPHPCLTTLFSHCPYIDHIVQLGDATPAFDFLVSLIYLPGIAEFIEYPPAITFPYLFADKQLVEQHKQLPTRHLGKKTFKIGLCWVGALHDYERFIALEQLVSTLYDKRIEFYSLQVGTGSEQIKQLPKNFFVHTFGPDFDKKHGSFMDTAAVMQNLDLVVTVDTSIAHLTGGLGVPVWVLLPCKPAWRWINNKPDILEWVRPHYKTEFAWMKLVGNSPWYPYYPTMQTFQQEQAGNWKPVLDSIKKALQEKLDGRETK